MDLNKVERLTESIVKFAIALCRAPFYFSRTTLIVRAWVLCLFLLSCTVLSDQDRESWYKTTGILGRGWLAELLNMQMFANITNTKILWSETQLRNTWCSTWDASYNAGFNAAKTLIEVSICDNYQPKCVGKFPAGSIDKVLYGEAPPEGSNPYPLIHRIQGPVSRKSR